MQAVKKVMMFQYGCQRHGEGQSILRGKLALKVATDYRKDDHNWWVSCTLPEGGASITLTAAHENITPGRMKLYFAISDVVVVSKQLSA